MAYQDGDGPLARLRDRFVQAVMREPAVILFERDADGRMRDAVPAEQERQPQEVCA